MDMRLNHEPFLAIKNGSKKIEIRLNDEKRSQLKIGDEIKFTDLETGAVIRTQVLKLKQFATFKQLFAEYSGSIIGSPDDQTIEELDQDNMGIYSRERERKYGALAIGIKLI
ncbi:ASCH domain-containing protein [Companilactobacillus kimchiensis]|uniref:ASCH domain-containing protein n=1 Tax=Companilactobacillus kimchiensis TaxID=993692 RepID=A0A0R2LFG0_9LACO|nr:ASCH domain-containing protein [Companilactobacillus kimchiensis]KRN98774.1 hypothetical protein IV57_GL000810 [Companilactobacillus kimchiensis]